MPTVISSDDKDLELLTELSVSICESVSIDEFIRRAKKGCATNYGGDPMKFEAKLEELRRLQERDGK